MLAPICLFVYNRPKETELTLNALKANYLAKESELFVFCDGPKNIQDKEKVEKVRELIYELNGFKKVEIKKKEKNIGLANSIINGVTEIINKFGKIIVLEDDLVTSPNFLDFMNQSLSFYRNFEKIKSVNGYSLSLKIAKKINNSDVYFQYRLFPWGWGTWRNEWDKELFYDEKIYLDILNKKQYLKNYLGNDIPRMLKGFIEGKNNSWYVRFVIQHLIEKKLSVFPFLSKVKNIGFWDEGTHCSNSINSYVHEIDTTFKRSFKFPNIIKKSYDKEFLKYFRKSHKIKYRLVLLKSSKGWSKVVTELKYKLTNDKS